MPIPWDVSYLPPNTPGLTYAASYVLSVLITSWIHGFTSEHLAVTVARNAGFSIIIFVIMCWTEGATGVLFFLVMSCVACVMLMMLVLNDTGT